MANGKFTMLENPVPWPNGARCAVSFTWDMDADSILHLAHPEDADTRLMSMTDLRYGPEVAVPRICRLFESYGIHFDPALRDEVLERVALVDLPSYSGFVMPRLEPVLGDDGEIVDVSISYPLDLTGQMLEYSGKRLP